MGQKVRLAGPSPGTIARRLLPREREAEFRAAAERRLRPDPSAVAFDDAAHGREANAGAFELVLAMQALEYAEELARLAHVEADAVVPHVDLPFPGHVLGADLDERLAARPGILHGVVDQVH